MAPPSKSKSVAAVVPKPGRFISSSINTNTVPTSMEPASTRSNESTKPSSHPQKAQSQSSTSVIEGMDKLSLSSNAPKGHKIISPTGQVNAQGGTDSTEDDQSQLSTSSTKGPSFDTKSMASVTTFAMDEKESLRPDDSASVQAAEEDEHHSTPPSGIGGSRPGSDIAAPRVQPRDTHNGPIMGTRRPMLATMANPPRFGDFPPPSPPEAARVDTNAHTRDDTFDRPPVAGNHTLAIAPDERLLDAMNTPKDRLFLLQLEEKYVAFIQQTEVAFLDLPPQNSFVRLLAHKLADYYNLSHAVSSDNASVRLFKLAHGILPAPLSVIAGALSGGGAPPPGAAAMKIMRRQALGQGKLSAEGSTNVSSSVPSKATSESGADAASDEGIMSPGGSVVTKDKSKWTREEKEAHYKAARERIFGDFQEAAASENNSNGDASADISRSSSCSGKKKTHRQRTPKDDSFEARSQFTPGYGSLAFSTTPTQYQPGLQPTAFTSTYAGNPTYVQPNYSTTPTPTYRPYEMQTQYMSGSNLPMTNLHGYSSDAGWTASQPTQPGSYYNFGMTNQSTPMYPQPPAMPLPGFQQYAHPISAGYPPPSLAWTNPPYQPQYQSPYMAQSPQAVHWPNQPSTPSMASTPPYPYGQLPSQAYAGNPQQNSQHPLPGSFNNRSIFNPQTRSFVPANTVKKGSSRKSGKGTQPQGPDAAAGRNSSGLPEQLPLADFGAQFVTRASTSPQGPNTSTVPDSPSDSLQKKFGVPGHLPKKPPPSQVHPSFHMESTPTLPSQQAFQPATSGSSVASGGSSGLAGSMNGAVTAGT